MLFIQLLVLRSLRSRRVEPVCLGGYSRRYSGITAKHARGGGFKSAPRSAVATLTEQLRVFGVNQLTLFIF